jgi:hypothetical protein
VSTVFNEHIRLAQAMLGGHLYVDGNVPWEHVTVNGHSYILHPPLSAFICLPFVAAGVTDQTLISMLIGVVSGLLAYRLARSGWLTAFFLLGTTFLYEATLGASWDFALVASTPFTLAALLEVNRNDRFLPCFGLDGSRYDDSRSWLVGLWAALAALCRYDLVLAFPVYWFVKRDYRILCGLGLWAIVYVWFNEARFGTLTDGSVAEWYWKYDSFRAQRPYGPFSIRYLPFNLYTLLWMAPAYQEGFPWLRPQFMGQALLSLSPAFLLARSGPWLMAAMLVSLPALTIYANGFSQLGCRYYVQVFPFLIAAMIQLETGGANLTGSAKALICASVFLSMSATMIVWDWGLA